MKTKNPKRRARSNNSRKRPASPCFERILTSTDFSEPSKAGLRYAGALADKLGGAVEVLNVIELPSPIGGMEAVIRARSEKEIRARAHRQLARVTEHELGGRINVTASVRTGKPFHEITTAAREGKSDLIVIATHGHTGWKHVLLGSTTEAVVRHAPCPVLTVPTRLPKNERSPRPLQIKRVVVPIDFSNVSKDALPYAVLLARRYRAKLFLLHVVETFPIDYLMGRELRDHTLVPLMKEAEARLKKLAIDIRKAARVQTNVVVRAGKPYVEICGAGTAAEADLIVLTTRGYTGLKHVWLGSTAERVVRHAACPVLVVRELEHKMFG